MLIYVCLIVPAVTARRRFVGIVTEGISIAGEPRDPEKMRTRCQTVEHPFGTLKHWMRATHFQMITLEHVGTARRLACLHVRAHNLKRVMNIIGVGGAYSPEKYLRYD